eukprot:8939595-Ditylum_brightwellii.AAC.1
MMRLLETIQVAIQLQNMALFEWGRKTHFVELLPSFWECDEDSCVNGRLDKHRNVIDLGSGQVKDNTDDKDCHYSVPGDNRGKGLWENA